MGDMRGEAQAIRARLWGEPGPDGEKPRPAHEEVQALVSDYPREEVLFLDFKSGVNLFRGASLDKDAARKILSKMVSAFANASGGVIVWGVTDWEKTGDDKPEPEDLPIGQAQELRRYLTDVQTKVTLPAAPDVRHVLLERPDGETAFVGTYIARSDGPPIQARSDKHEGRYFRRHSNGTAIMTHDEIADMFGRRPYPVLEPAWHMEPGGKSGGGHAKGRLVLGIRNVGRAVARFPALFLHWRPTSHYSVEYELDGNRNAGLPHRPETIGRKWRPYVGTADDCIHPGVTFSVTALRFAAYWGMPELYVEMQLHADGAVMVEGAWTFTEKEFAQRLPMGEGP